MSEFKPDNYVVWDRLFTFLFECDDEGIARDEVRADLQTTGVNVRPIIDRFNVMVEQHRAKARLAAAKQQRLSLVDQMRTLAAPRMDDLRNGVREFINRAFSGPEQVAHFHKLESAATDDDLQSLLDDLTRLASLREHKDQHGSKA